MALTAPRRTFVAHRRTFGVGVAGLALAAAMGVGLTSTMGANASTDATQAAISCDCGGGCHCGGGGCDSGGCHCGGGGNGPCPCPTNGPCPGPTHSPTTSPTYVPTPTPTTSTSTPAPAAGLRDGVHTGSSFSTSEGTFHVQIHVSDGRIDAARVTGANGHRAGDEAAVFKAYNAEVVKTQSVDIAMSGKDQAAWEGYRASLAAAIEKARSHDQNHTYR